MVCHHCTETAEMKEEISTIKREMNELKADVKSVLSFLTTVFQPDDDDNSSDSVSPISNNFNESRKKLDYSDPVPTDVRMVYVKTPSGEKSFAIPCPVVTNSTSTQASSKQPRLATEGTRKSLKRVKMDSGIKCCVFGCQTEAAKHPELSYHRLPSDRELRKVWLKAIRQRRWPGIGSSRICSRHFPKDAIETREHYGIGPRRQLAKGAVPSLFPYNDYGRLPKPNDADMNSSDEEYDSDEDRTRGRGRQTDYQFRCCFVGCDSKAQKSTAELSFHRFPKDAYLRQIWVEIIGLSGWEPKYHERLCSKHFPGDAIEFVVTGNINQGLRPRLVKGAMPLPLGNSVFATGNNAGSNDPESMNSTSTSRKVRRPFIDRHVISCCVPGCSNNTRTTTGIGFHRFPKDEALKCLWTKAMGRENWTPASSSRVCSQHFDPQDVFSDYVSTRPRVVPGAVPKRFPLHKLLSKAVHNNLSSAANSGSHHQEQRPAAAEEAMCEEEGSEGEGDPFGEDMEVPEEGGEEDPGVEEGEFVEHQPPQKSGRPPNRAEGTAPGIFLFGEQDYAMQLETALSQKYNYMVVKDVKEEKS